MNSAPDGVRVEALEKIFDGHVALRRVDLVVPWGGIVALLGPNGAGKSTLLRVLGTTVLPDRGRAEVAGLDVVAHPAAARRRLGMVLGEERSWYWRLSGRSNLEFFAALQGLARDGARGRVADLLAEVGLTEAADRRFDRYSAGMRARLSLARALLCEPPVLLLDEPTRTMDPLAASAFRGEVRRQAEAGRAVLFATHDLHEAAAVASKVVVMAGGGVVATTEDRCDAATLEDMVVQAVDSAGAPVER